MDRAKAKCAVVFIVGGFSEGDLLALAVYLASLKGN
jgi:hypothetical protein